MTQSTNNDYSYAYGLTHNYASPYAYQTVDIHYDDSIKAIDYNVLIHELGHAWDHYYNYKTGKGFITDQSSFRTYYNLIKGKIDSAYTSENQIGEVWAASVSNYYFHVLKMKDSEPYYALKSGAKLSETELNSLKTMMEGFINEANKW